jgi:hypothetical protein
MVETKKIRPGRTRVCDHLSNLERLECRENNYSYLLKVPERLRGKNTSTVPGARYEIIGRISGKYLP